MTFRFPAPLVQAIEAQARGSGRDRTTVVIEALAQVFGLAMPAKATVTIDMVQQQVKQVESSVISLSQQLLSLQHTCIDSSALYRLELLEQFANSLKVLLSTTLSEPQADLVLPGIIESMCSSHDRDHSQRSVAAGRLQLTAQLEPQTDLLTRVLATMPDPVFVCDRSQRLLYINPLGAQALGLEQRCALQQPLQAFALPPDLKAQLIAQCETVFATGRSCTSDIRFITPLYGLRDYEYTLSPLSGSIEHIDAVLFSSKEITERKRLEAALKTAAANYQNLLSSQMTRF